MRSTKQSLKPMWNGKPSERISLRVESGVEIYEHETHKVCRIPKPSGSPFSDGREPLLVVESGRSASPIFTKRRSEIPGLSTILNSLTGIS